MLPDPASFRIGQVTVALGHDGVPSSDMGMVAIAWPPRMIMRQEHMVTLHQGLHFNVERGIVVRVVRRIFLTSHPARGENRDGMSQERPASSCCVAAQIFLDDSH